MKVLILCDKWGALGGKEQTTLDCVEGLKARGHECVVVYESVTDKPWAAGIAEGVRLYPVPALSKYVDSQDARHAEDLRKVLDREGPDVILLRDVLNLRMLRVLIDYGRILAIAQNCRIFCLRESKTFYFSKKPCERKLGAGCLLHGCFLRKNAGSLRRGLRYNSLRQLMRVATLYQEIRYHVVDSHYMRGVFLQHGFRADQVEVIGSFADVSVARDGHREDRTPNILFLGRIDRYKGVDYLLRALSKLEATFTCTIVGDGPYLPLCRRLCRRLGLNGVVRFTGWVARDLTSDYLQAASIAVVPSIWPEEFGRVGIEAMAHAKPVVAFDNGGISDWLHHGKTGYLVPSKDITGLARRIEELLRNPRLAREFGAAGRQVVVTKFNRDAFFERLIGALERASEGPGGSTPGNLHDRQV